MKWPRKSYAQMGEDLIIENNINKYGLKGDSLTYLEIGTNHPCNSNNTYLFYEQGSKGILVEPDEFYWKKIEEHRPRDVLIKSCVSDHDGTADFYVMTARTLNTLKKSSAEQSSNDKRMGKQQIERVIKVPLINVNNLLKRFQNRWPNIISVDTEGVDLDILRAIDWKRYKVEIVCAEAGDQKDDIVKLMLSNGYTVLGDNCLNIIFGRK
jgi:FkbM family methyltransferase